MNMHTGVPAPVYDSTRDASDNWMDEVDPNNEQGLIVTALFQHERGHGHQTAYLVGIEVQGDGHTKIYDRHDAMILLSFETVERVEDAQTTAIYEGRV